MSLEMLWKKGLVFEIWDRNINEEIFIKLVHNGDICCCQETNVGVGSYSVQTIIDFY